MLYLKEGLPDYVMKLLACHSLFNLPLEMELVHQLEWYFKAYNKRYLMCICTYIIMLTILGNTTLLQYNSHLYYCRCLFWSVILCDRPKRIDK